MNRLTFVPACGAVALAGLVTTAMTAQTPASTLNRLTDAEKKAGWTLLFDGQSLDGWRGYKKADAKGTRWKIEEGLLTVPPKDGKDTLGAQDLITANTYDRFELTAEWRVAEGANSGIKYFVLEDQDSAVGHEYQVIDDTRHPDAKIGPERQTAALYDVLQAANRPIKPAGEWNTTRIVSDGTTVEHWLNGTQVLKYELDTPVLKAAVKDSKFSTVARFGKLQKGHLLLQDHSDRVYYRNLKVRTLPAK